MKKIQLHVIAFLKYVVFSAKESEYTNNPFHLNFG
jgi:hypothetical protein